MAFGPRIVDRREMKGSAVLIYVPRVMSHRPIRWAEKKVLVVSNQAIN